MTGIGESTLFGSAHEALLFAFRFASNQSPRTPMLSMMQGGPLGKGKGLVGLDGAGQAGIVLGSLRHLNVEQRNLLVVRYGDVRSPCICCGQDAPTREWTVAVDALSRCRDLGDLPRSVRHAAVERIVCRRRAIDVRYVASPYHLNDRTLRSRIARARKHFTAVENAAIAWLEDHFESQHLVPAA